MALIKTSALVSAINGTVGGNVFSRNRGGNYVRKWAKGIASNTPGQQAARQNLSSISQFYRTLTQSERSDWKNAALEGFHQVKNRLGEVYTQSGYQYFMSMNMTAATIDVPFLRRPSLPVSYPVLTVSGSSFDKDPIGNKISLFLFNQDLSVDASGAFSYVLQINRPAPVGKDVKPDRILKVIKPGDDGFEYDPATGQLTLDVPYSEAVAKFGEYENGMSYILSARAISDVHPWDVLAKEMEESATVNG